MIPRHQTVLFILLLAASVLMGVLLWNQLRLAHHRLLQGQDLAPTQAPQVAPAEQATLMVANDADNTVQLRILSLPLPQNPEARARAVLGELLDLYAAPDAAHPVPGGAGSIAQVFLVPIADAGGKVAPEGPELAVVNLTGAFAAGHPSGLETEALTVLSVCATLNANFPRVTQVRFLVDGQPRATLAGHADLTRTYLTGESTAPAAGDRP
ncbi:MAG: GerMN domain-containing protein [Terracidiphilus sp.]